MVIDLDDNKITGTVVSFSTETGEVNLAIKGNGSSARMTLPQHIINDKGEMAGITFARLE